MSIQVRRVVTGHDAGGQGVVVFDGVPPQCVEDSVAGVGIAELWATNVFPAENTGQEEAVPDALPIAPGPAGTVFRIVEFPPELGDVPDTAAVQSFLQNQGTITPADPRHPGMHKTDTIDYAIVLSGQIDLLLDQEDVTLYAGDTVVQRGTFHAWANRYQQPCQIAFILVAAAPTC